MKACSKCGTKWIKKSMNYCPACGFKIVPKKKKRTSIKGKTITESVLLLVELVIEVVVDILT